MKESPILFNAAMVRALLAGAKTQTRRVMKIQPPSDKYRLSTLLSTTGRKCDEGKSHWITMLNGYTIDDGSQPLFSCPYGYAGDQLWVKETWRTWKSLDHVKPSLLENGIIIDYAAGGNSVGAGLVCDVSEKWRPSLYMQKRFSRIQLEITGVRVERLNDISEADARAEGGPQILGFNNGKEKFGWQTYIEWYQELWESINGAGSWDANPWVWVVEFKVIKPTK